MFLRDRFVCRYCGGKTILTPVMHLVGFLYPDIFPEHSFFKGGVTHPAFITRSPLVDHVRPGSSSGEWLDPDNLVTACNPCNSIKAGYTLEQLGWDLRPIAQTTWDGLTRYYGDLWHAAGEPAETYHLGWLRDLERARASLPS